MSIMIKKALTFLVCGIFIITAAVIEPNPSIPVFADSSAIIIDHNYTKLDKIPSANITNAKNNLHIAYGHTSHGSQLVDGMNGLVDFKGDLYDFNSGGTSGALDLRDTPFSDAYDLGNPDFTAWYDATKAYLDKNADINVVMWSWCGQVSNASTADISTYLSEMNSLEIQYPNVKFVYFTGHLDGTGLTGNLHLRNNQIRDYCKNNGKILYDFEDIESYNPDDVYFGNKYPDDACDYDSNGDGSKDKNWAEDWQNSHTLNVDWYNCSSAHSKPLNANQKAYAAWSLFARLSGWQGVSPSPTPTPKIIHVKGIKLNKVKLTLAKGKTYKLTATINPTNASNKKVTWKSGSKKIATVSSKGVVKGIRKGAVNIYVYTVEGKKCAKCKVIIK